MASSNESYSCVDRANFSRDSITPEYWETSKISEAHSINATATAVIMLVFFLIGLPANILIIISILYQKLYKETTHIFLLNLAISDLLVCLLVMPFIIVTGFAGEYIFGDSDYTRCQVCQTALIYIALTNFSVKILAFISIDRFIYIKCPLRYETLVTPARVTVAVVLAWLLSIMESILPLFGFGEYNFSFRASVCIIDLTSELGLGYGAVLVAIALIFITTTVFLNIWIICIVRKQIRTVYHTKRNFDNQEEQAQYNKGLRLQIRKKRNRKQLVLIRAFGAILLGNFIAWLPVTVHIVLVLAIGEESIPLGYYSLVFLTFIMHSVLHPLIEGCFIPQIRETFKVALGIQACQKRMSKEESVTGCETKL